MASLKHLRNQIDRLDQSLLKLLNQRGRLVQDIGVLKERNGQSIFAPSRERELLRRLKKNNPGPLSAAAIDHVFQEVVHACRNLQKQMSVAYFGPEASFSHAAALKSFGRSAVLLPARTISEVFAEVEKGRADFGVVPIENSTGGGVYHTLDMFIDSPLSICAELELPVHHYLLGKSIRHAIADEGMIGDDNGIAGIQERFPEELNQLVTAGADNDAIGRDFRFSRQRLAKRCAGAVRIAKKFTLDPLQRAQSPRRRSQRILIGGELDDAAQAQLAPHAFHRAPGNVRFKMADFRPQ